METKKENIFRYDTWNIVQCSRSVKILACKKQVNQDNLYTLTIDDYHTRILCPVTMVLCLGKCVPVSDVFREKLCPEKYQEHYGKLQLL